MKFFDEETKEFLLESLIKNSAVVNKYAPEARLLEKWRPAPPLLEDAYTS